MKLISLNTWGCRTEELIFDYIRENAESTDIFCFQEILKGGNGKTDRGEIKSAYEDIAKILSHHTGYFSEYGEGGYYGESSKGLDFKFGIASFVKNGLKQSFVDNVELRDPNRKWSDYSGRFAVGISLAVVVENYAVINIHGLWQNSIKTDTEAKIEQSKRIIDLAGKIKGKKVICGDFNLLPETKSIQILGNEYKNLIQEYGIKSTRSSLYSKEIRYSDFAFTDKDIVVNNFSVPDLNVSDHLPLVLEVE